MKLLRIPLRIVFYKDDGDWVAHCLEFDLVGDGATQQDALHSLNQAIRLQVETSIESNNSANLFVPADGRYFEMFAAGNEVAVEELEIALESFDNVSFDRVEAREYAEAEASVT